MTLAFLVFADIARPMGNVLYDHLMRLHGFRATQDIVIVAVDDRSLAELGGWPLHRNQYTKLLERLDDDRYRPKVIGFDLLFLDPTVDDSGLANAMRHHNAVLPLEFKLLENTQQSLEPTLPVEPLANTAHIGHINLSFDHDGVIRGIKTAEHNWLHFSLAMHMQGQLKQPPTSTDVGYRRFRMVDPRVGFPMVSLSDAIHDSFTRSLLKDKYVLVGVTAPSLGDRYPTLYSGKNNASTPGVAILASVLNASLNRALIQEAPPLVVFSLALIPLFIMLQSLVMLRPSMALILAVVMMLCGVGLSYLLLTLTDYWIDPIPFVLVAVLLQPLWAWRRLEAIVHLVEDKAAYLRQFQPAERAQPDVKPSREVVLQYAKLLDHAVASARSELDFLSSVVDEMPDAVAIFDAQDHLLLSNQKINQLFGADNLRVGSGLIALAAHLDIPLAALSGLPNTQTTSATQPVFQLNTLQGQREFFLKTTSLDSPLGGSLRLLILMDVTELRQSQIQRDRALQFLSHDMRTPVASILSLTRKSNSTEQTLDELPREKIILHANALLHMMDDFILTVSAEAAQYNLQQELLDNLLNDAIEQVADLADAKGITIRDESEPNTLFVHANTRLLVRALVNLLFNAIKFSPVSGTICVQASAATSNHAVITIQNVVEMTADATDRIPSMPGFGLGLDFVDTVIRKHQGSITREIPQHGMATIQISLPANLG
jgi:CHASE2 domain-containing sensor protein/signal transduction histidine kinase